MDYCSAVYYTCIVGQIDIKIVLSLHIDFLPFRWDIQKLRPQLSAIHTYSVLAEVAQASLPVWDASYVEWESIAAFLHYFEIITYLLCMSGFHYLSSSVTSSDLWPFLPFFF